MARYFSRLTKNFRARLQITEHLGSCGKNPLRQEYNSPACVLLVTHRIKSAKRVRAYGAVAKGVATGMIFG